MLQRLRYAHAAREASRPMSAQPVGAAVSCTDVNPLGRPACPLIRSTIPSTGSSALRKLALLRSSCFVPNFFARQCRDGRGAALVASRLHQFKNDGQPGHNSPRGPRWCHDSDPAWLELLLSGSACAALWRNDHQGWRVVHHRRKLRGGAMIDNRSQVFDLARKTTRAVGAFAACAFALCVVFGFTVVAAIIVAAT